MDAAVCAAVEIPPGRNTVSGGFELVRDRQHVRSTAKGRIEVAGGCVELREFEWDAAGWVMPDSDHFYISRLVSPLKGDRRLRWHNAQDGRALNVAQFGIHAPNTPIMIAHGPGSACFLICEITVARFHEMTGASEWPQDWALRALSSDGPFFKAILDRLTGEVLRPHADSPRFIDALLTAFVIELHRISIHPQESAEDRGGLADWQLHRARDLIRDNRTISEVAHRCGISVRHLTRGFRAAEGITLHEYRTQARMARAREMLADGAKPLKLIARDTGFASPSHFAAAFRRTVGCSPSEYRASIRTV